MKTPVQITFRHIPQSVALEEKIREKLDKLARLYPEILDCDATIDQIDRHQQQGRHFRVAIGVRIRGEELIANTNHEDAFIALRNALATVRRQLEKAIGKRRLNARSPAMPETRTKRAGTTASGEEALYSVYGRAGNGLPDALPFMEEEEAVELLSGEVRRVDPERLAENVEQY